MKNKGVKGLAGDIWHGLEAVGGQARQAIADPAAWSSGSKGLPGDPTVGMKHPPSAGPAPSAPGAYNPDDMINSVWIGLSQPQTERIKALLAQQGITEKTNVHQYRAALEGLNQSVPGLSQYSKDASIFSGGAGGTSDISSLAASLAQLDAPYMADLNKRADASQAYMAPLIAKLPSSMQGLANISEQDQLTGMRNLAASQLLSAQSQPIANALQLQQRLQSSIGQTQLRQALQGLGTGSAGALPPLGPVPKP